MEELRRRIQDFGKYRNEIAGDICYHGVFYQNWYYALTKSNIHGRIDSRGKKGRKAKKDVKETLEMDP